MRARVLSNSMLLMVKLWSGSIFLFWLNQQALFHHAVNLTAVPSVICNTWLLYSVSSPKCISCVRCIKHLYQIQINVLGPYFSNYTIIAKEFLQKCSNRPQRILSWQNAKWTRIEAALYSVRIYCHSIVTSHTITISATFLLNGQQIQPPLTFYELQSSLH